MATNFLNISRQDCLKYYQTIIDNSDRHFSIAESIAGQKEYGIASSHLILGTEELIKALIIYLDGEGLEIRKIKGVQKFFSRHTIRHFFSGLFFFISKVIKPTIETVNRIKNLLHNPESRLNMTEFETAVLNNDEKKVEQLSKEWSENTVKLYVDRFELYREFWAEAEIYKQRGFYVDYDNKLLTPEQITENSYIQAKEITNSFRKECKDLIKFVHNLQENDKMKFSKTINQDKRFYHMLEDLISGQNL